MNRSMMTNMNTMMTTSLQTVKNFKTIKVSSTRESISGVIANIVPHNFADAQEPQKIFSPQQFILDQNSNNRNNHNHDHPNHANTNHNNHHGIDEDGEQRNEDEIKPAISFQQQQFQNGGTLTVTNSHVTVSVNPADQAESASY